MYAKIGRFKPGDILVPLNLKLRDSETKVKVIGIKYRKDKTKSMYRLRKLENEMYTYSQLIHSIDKIYVLSLSQVLKNL